MRQLLAVMCLSTVAAQPSSVPSHCAAVWDATACEGSECYSCGDRMLWVHNNQMKSLEEAISLVASEFPKECGICNQPAPPPIPSSGVHRSCEEDWATTACDGTDCYPCGARIEWLRTNNGLSLDESMERVGGEFSECKGCLLPPPPPPPPQPQPQPQPQPPSSSPSCLNVWNDLACAGSDCYTCGDRITWVSNNKGLSMEESMQLIADEFPSVCGGCGRSCDSVWDTPACDSNNECYSCGDRIEWMVANQHLSTDEGKAFVGLEFPNECGPCAGMMMPPTPPSPPSPPPPSNMILVWSDEFEGNSLDTSKWGFDLGAGGWGNNEAQTYTERAATVSNGVLKITTTKTGNGYESARVVSRGKGDWTYGKFEVRAKLPLGRGTWPAIWMLPTEWKYGGWPDSGEIDIMEHVGFDEGTIHGTTHTRSGFGGGGDSGKIDKSSSVDAFHTYSITWTETGIDWHCDGVHYHRYVKKGNQGTDQWPFDEDFHFLINTAVGGTWGGAHGIDDSIFPVDFEIDYVRVYSSQQNQLPPPPTPPSPPSPPSPSPTTSLVTMSYNMYGWNALNNDHLKSLIVNQINDVKPDILGGQELDGKSSEIAARTGLTASHSEHHGLQIFYRASVVRRLSTGSFNLAEMDQWGQRVVIWTEFEVVGSGKRFTHFNTHWCVCSENKLFDSAKTTAYGMRQALWGPIVLTGDFNVAQGYHRSKAIRYLTGESVSGLTSPTPLTDAHTSGTTLGAGRIDFVLFSGFSKKSSWIPPRAGSDHNSVVAVLAL